ncbi:hypothetical protein VTI74DRAFT_9340 [Chaetomium olivicolor]
MACHKRPCAAPPLNPLLVNQQDAHSRLRASVMLISPSLQAQEGPRKDRTRARSCRRRDIAAPGSKHVGNLLNIRRTPSSYSARDGVSGQGRNCGRANDKSRRLMRKRREKRDSGVPSHRDGHLPRSSPLRKGPLSRWRTHWDEAQHRENGSKNPHSHPMAADSETGHDLIDWGLVKPPQCASRMGYRGVGGARECLPLSRFPGGGLIGRHGQPTSRVGGCGLVGSQRLLARGTGDFSCIFFP